MRPTDADLRALAVGRAYDPLDPAWKELIFRTRQLIWRKMPNPEGVCGHSLRVYSDQHGAYSSGYVCHAGGRDGICNGGAGYDVVWHTVPGRERLLALLNSLPAPSVMHRTQ